MKRPDLFLRLLKELLIKEYRKVYLLHILKSIAERSGTFVNIIYMTRVLKELTNNQFEQVRETVLEYLAIFACIQILSAILAPVLEDMRLEMRRTIIAKPYEKTMRMNFHYADQTETHDKLHQINRDMVQNNSSVLRISEQLFVLIENIVSLCWSLVLLVPLWTSGVASETGRLVWIHSNWLNILLVILVLLSVGMQTGLMQRVYSVMSQQSEQTRETNALYYHMTTKLHDPESGKEIRLYNLQESIQRVMLKQTQGVLDWYQEYYNKNQTAALLNNLTSQLITVALYALVGVRVLLGGLPAALVVQLSGALSQMILTLPQLMSFLAVFNQFEPLERYYEIMDYPEEVIKGSLHVEKRLDNNYQLSVDKLTFSYPNAQEKTLNAITQDFDVGKKYAIVGGNGSGKTTFIKVLMRLYETSQGRIKLNQIDTNKYNLSEYYQIFSVVFQDFCLLSFTLGQNIAVQEIFDTQLATETLEEVGLNGFLEKLPLGLSTYLGSEFEDGVNLSGGQSQKVAMARALYKDAPIMILDEPTAALDPIAEFEIYKKFAEVAENKTAFYISHRLSSCRFCDEVLVFDQGEIVQRGSHEKLIQVEGKYQELWYAQAQYYV